jgi:hypothetical protein
MPFDRSDHNLIANTRRFDLPQQLAIIGGKLNPALLRNMICWPTSIVGVLRGNQQELFKERYAKCDGNQSPHHRAASCTIPWSWLSSSND